MIYDDDATPPRRASLQRWLTRDWSLVLIKTGSTLATIAFGGLFWLVNGGFSVRGLESICQQLGPGGALFWKAVSRLPLPWTFDIPEIPATQPALPWIGVLAASLIQIGIVLRILQRRSIPHWVTALGILLSLYDLVTTFFGFGTLEWVQRGGFLVQVPFTILFTFGLETLIGYLLKRR